jgi:cell division protein FtsI (penicillin-binding protein 3)
VIGESTEPGSTFKLASLMVAMEDGYIDLDDTVNIGNGTTTFYNAVMRDSHHEGPSRITVQETFEKSSNVGVSKLIVKYYQKNPKKFVDRLCKMNLNTSLGLDIPGEGKPLIKNPKDKDWSGTTLPWMSIGYEERLTPIQMLTFYNAVANNGRMVKPAFVREIRKRGSTEKAFKPTVINESICSMETINKAKKMLEGVVERGTGSVLKQASYSVAGKTGTAQISNAKYGYKSKEKISYQASFVGYFPADKPKYTCIVVVNAPSNGVYYGGSVACPIFREVADKVYSTSLDMHKELKKDTARSIQRMPYVKGGYAKDLSDVASIVNIPFDSSKSAEWTSTVTGKNKVSAQPRKINDTQIPNVMGMSVNDALYILENKGLNVKLTGKGLVTKQFPEPGTKLVKGTLITLELI